MKNLLVFGILAAMFSCSHDSETNDNEWVIIYKNPNLIPSNLFFFGDTGILFGQIFKDDSIYSVITTTSDNGRNWKEIYYPQGFPEFGGFWNMFPLNSKIIFAASHSNLYKSIDGGITWNLITSTLFAGGGGIILFFRDSVSGFFSSSDQIYKTNNGGFDWSLVSNENIMSGVGNFQFPSKLIGYAAGGIIDEYNNSGLLLKTLDGGNNWMNLNFNSGCITDLFFIDSLRGYSFTYDGKLLKTINGGHEWNIINNHLDEVTYAHSYFWSEFEGCYCNNNHIWSTRNGGKSWKIEFEGRIDSISFVGIKFVDLNNIYAYTSNGNIYKKVSSIH